MNERRCIITNEPITPENNSRAHVIPSALGGRLKPWDLLSKTGNGLLGDKIDLPLIQAFQALMTLLNGSRDRGENQPVRMTDTSGRTYVMEFGEPLKLANFNYREEPIEDGSTAFYIDARNLKELRTLLGRVKAKHSEFDIDEAMEHAVAVRSWADGMQRGQLQFGPRAVFPALFVSASIFAAHHNHTPHPGLRDYVARFDPDQPEMPPDTFYFIPPRPWISAPGEVTHIVALLASAERKQMLVYFELFKAVPVATLLPYNGTEDARATYAVDVLTGAEVQAAINEEVIEDLVWQATHQLGDNELLRFMQERIGRLIGLSQERAWKAELEAVKTRAFGNDEDGPLTPEGLVKGVGEIAEFVMLHWRRPLTTLSRMEQELRQFDGLLSGLEKLVASSGRPAFRALIRVHREKLVTAIERKTREETS
jgi:hypothetical protein